jgi:hypothetical protein
MSQNIQEIFNRLREQQKQQKEIKATYRDALKNSGEYQELSDQLQVLKDKKKQVEDGVRSGFSAEFNKLEELKVSMEADKLMLSDLAVTQIARGEAINLVDEYDQKYEPVFSVRFKKEG